MKKSKPKAKKVRMGKADAVALRIAGAVLFGHPISKFKKKLWAERLDIVVAARKAMV